MAIPFPTKTRTWDLSTPANGIFFNDEFDQLYANDNDLQSQIDALGGVVAQRQITVDSSSAIGSTLGNLDDTIPQTSEADEYMNVVITPTDITNLLIIRVVAYMTNSTTGTMIASIFKDAITDSLASTGLQKFTGGAPAQVVLQHEIIAGTLLAQTFRFKVGVTSGTLTFNGRTSIRDFGGVANSFIEVVEVTG